MNTETYSRIYNTLEQEMWNIKNKRRKGIDGLAVCKDKLALRWQRLERLLMHIGCHSFALRDRQFKATRNARCAYYERHGIHSSRNPEPEEA